MVTQFRVDPFTPEDERITSKLWKRLPGCGSPRSLKLWMYTGLKTPFGLHKLPSAKIGGVRFTTLAAYRWWVDRLNE